MDFQNTVLIMTSNVGSQLIDEGERTGEHVDPAVLDRALRRTFRPEFLNRIDDVITFHRLTPEHLERIVEIQLDKVHTLLAERELALTLDPEATRLIAERGYDPAYGARPLRRAISRLLIDPLAEQLIGGSCVAGDRVRVGVADETLTFRWVGRTEEAAA